MTLTTLHITCPCCESPCEVLEGFDGEVVECSTCGWEFGVGPDGEITDDGGLDVEPPFELDDEGEWIRESDAEPDWASTRGHGASDWEVFCPYCRSSDPDSDGVLTPLDAGEVRCEECGEVFSRRICG